MKQAFLFLVLLVGAAKGFACSMSVNHNYTKNLLVAHAAGYHDLSLAAVSGIAITDYDHSFEGGAGGGSCPDYLITTARVSMNHSPSALSHCTYNVTVTHTVYIGNDLPDGPMEDVAFSSATAACSTSIIGRKIPRKLPYRIKKPILARPFPG